jgi:copper homeostasis protein
MRPIVFELCAETLDACLAARAGGAARIELCSALSEGGLTPSHGLIAAAIRLTALPVHVMVRPRADSFCYTEDETALMIEDIQHAKHLGAAGVVLGALTTDHKVDQSLTQQLIAAARPMPVTFHRAFDETPSLPDALETLIALGCDRILTSGGHPDVLTGADTLKALVEQANGRIDIAVGGGLRIENAATVARLTNAMHFHGSLNQPVVTGIAVQQMIQQLKMF